ncbi:MAG: hypothetical protein NTX24_02350 [Candidatus Pacearchaeota archaeon]|nr:hypothetical protein [Candidatus Pacearchaeota archaeon]
MNLERIIEGTLVIATLFATGIMIGVMQPVCKKSESFPSETAPGMQKEEPKPRIYKGKSSAYLNDCSYNLRYGKI